jgi:uncharacterized protein
MKTLEEIKRVILTHKDELRDKYKVKEIGIFGSVARGEQRKDSDVDVIVEFNKTPDVFLLIDLEDYLKTLIDTDVDVVRKAAIRDELKDRIAKEAMYI